MEAYNLNFQKMIMPKRKMVYKNYNNIEGLIHNYKL